MLHLSDRKGDFLSVSDVTQSKVDLSVELKQCCVLIIGAHVHCEEDFDETCVSSGETVTED